MAAYRGEAAGNGAKAAILAGYAKPSAKVTASKLLKKANVQAAIANHEAETRRVVSSIADAAERDGILSDILRKSDSEVARIMAARELNKVGGRHITKLEHNLPSVPAGGVLFVIQQQPGAENRT